MSAMKEVKYQRATDEGNLACLLENNEQYLALLRCTRKQRLFSLIVPRFQKLYQRYAAASAPEGKNRACAAALDAWESTIVWRSQGLFRCWCEDLWVLRQQAGKRKRIDNADKGRLDYYSVAVIVKNEARNIREFILFYLATGAERIYIYDNESTDGLLEELEPFLKSGLVVYQYWPGHTVQTAAYRDAVRRTRRNTRWLALIDADEFLFSPLGSMPQQLRKYERYPGIGVNWLLYGPNGHDRRPSGLIMDNYTTRVANPESCLNCHIKSIVQPRRVLCIHHVHYAIYKGGQFAVNERGEIIDNYGSFIMKTGRAFTATNHRSVFRINHYVTKSLEDLELKCQRGYPDGSPKTTMEDQLRMFQGEMTEDYAIEPYADLVRAGYESRTLPQTWKQDERHDA